MCKELSVRLLMFSLAKNNFTVIFFPSSKTNFDNNWNHSLHLQSIPSPNSTTLSGASLNKVTWPILRLCFASILPYRWRWALGFSVTYFSAASTCWPRTLSMTAGACNLISGNGAPRTPRIWVSNCEKSQASIE